ncbi:hypothetical protein BRADI_1g43551v3 [Brachypodium distachyon]|uniref:Uncharacterized protein n=1 Tax=Brachypodium distachyon TaxID=15368 RepID=A0A0Q3K2Q9_BRADI|nr:hypothetical protein BRADI_1g43551v3 [Brachypodium distachyon]
MVSPLVRPLPLRSQSGRPPASLPDPCPSAGEATYSQHITFPSMTVRRPAEENLKCTSSPCPTRAATGHPPTPLRRLAASSTSTRFASPQPPHLSPRACRPPLQIRREPPPSIAALQQAAHLHRFVPVQYKAADPVRDPRLHLYPLC